MKKKYNLRVTDNKIIPSDTMTLSYIACFPIENRKEIFKKLKSILSKDGQRIAKKLFE